MAALVHVLAPVLAVLVRAQAAGDDDSDTVNS